MNGGGKTTSLGKVLFVSLFSSSYPDNLAYFWFSNECYCLLPKFSRIRYVHVPKALVSSV